jgi:hypothetical protein
LSGEEVMALVLGGMKEVTPDGRGGDGDEAGTGAGEERSDVFFSTLGFRPSFLTSSTSSSSLLRRSSRSLSLLDA